MMRLWSWRKATSSVPFTVRSYAEEKEMQFTLTKEGMYPEFLLDGIAYKA